MKTNQNVFKHYGHIVIVILAMVIFGCRCTTSKPTPDPLAGFHFSSINNLHSNKSINEDYQNYIREIPSNEKDFVGAINFFENGSGEHAVEVRIGVGGVWWEHVLIYDKDDRRVKTIKYQNGGYRS